MFTARYGMISYIKHITSGLQKVNTGQVMILLYDVSREQLNELNSNSKHVNVVSSVNSPKL